MKHNVLGKIRALVATVIITFALTLIPSAAAQSRPYAEIRAQD